MIEILESANYLVAMKISGSITADDISNAYKATEEKLKENERISFFAEIDDSMSFTLEGLIRDLKEALGQFGKLSKYYRAAIVTNKGWLGALARVEGLVFSSIDVRVFPPEERDKAFAWASEKPEPVAKPEEPAPSIHVLHTSSENVFAYEVTGRLREKDLKSAIAAFSPYLEKPEKVNVLARLKNFSGFDLLAVLDDELIKMKFKSSSKVGRYAVVGASSWMRNFLELMNPLVGAEIKTFDEADEAEAWEWVGAQQSLLAGK